MDSKQRVCHYVNIDLNQGQFDILQNDARLVKLGNVAEPPTDEEDDTLKGFI